MSFLQDDATHPPLEIGATLREARLGKRLEPAGVEAATMIPARFVAALEAERFEQLPPGVYARSFLREYADFLGLDGDLFVAAYDAQAAPPEPAPAPEPPRRRVGAGLQPRWILGLVALAAAAIAVWQLGSPGGTHATKPPAAAHRPAHEAHARATPTTHKRTPTTTPPLTLTAARGDCWLLVHLGSPGGPVVYEHTLLQGQTVRFGLKKPLAIRFGAPWNLDASIGRRSVTPSLPRAIGDVLVTVAGIEPAS